MQVAAAVVVSEVGEGEDAARLFPGCCEYERGDGDGLLVPAHAVNVRPCRVEEGPVFLCEVQALERALDEVAVVCGRPADEVDVVPGQLLALVDHGGACDGGGEGEEVVGRDLVAEGLEQVGHDAAAREGI
jgi:hypothetical protein